MCQTPEVSIWQRISTSRRVWQRVQGLRWAEGEEARAIVILGFVLRSIDHVLFTGE